VGPAPPGSARTPPLPPIYCVECTVTSLLFPRWKLCEPGNLNFQMKGIPHQNPGCTCRAQPSNRASTGPCAPRPRFLCPRSEIWKSWRTHASSRQDDRAYPSPVSFLEPSTECRAQAGNKKGPPLGFRQARAAGVTRLSPCYSWTWQVDPPRPQNEKFNIGRDSAGSRCSFC
jgi:hypothetical protein